MKSLIIDMFEYFKIHRYVTLQLHPPPPNNPTINLMRDQTFLQANKIFIGQLRINKDEGLDVAQSIKSIDPQIYRDCSGLSRGDTEVLLHKIF